MMSSATVTCRGMRGGALETVAMVVRRRTSTQYRARVRFRVASGGCRPSGPHGTQPRCGTFTVGEAVSSSRRSEHSTPPASSPRVAPAPSTGPGASVGLRCSRYSCRSWRTNSWRRRCSSRSRSLTLICRASREERNALASVKAASAPPVAGGAMRGMLNVRPENLVVATVTVSFPDFPKHRTRIPRQCPGGRVGGPSEAIDRSVGGTGIRPGIRPGRLPERRRGLRCTRSMRTEERSPDGVTLYK